MTKTKGGIMRFIQKAILLFSFFMLLSFSSVFADEPVARPDETKDQKSKSTLAYLGGAFGIFLSLGMGYKLRRVYDSRRQGLTG